MDDEDSHYQAPDLSNTPYDYHVYMASAPDPQRTDLDLIDKLERGKCSGLKVYRTTGSGNDVKKDIEQGMLKSRRIVFLYTDEYRGEVWRSFQIQIAHDRVKALNGDHVIVLKATSQPVTDIKFGRDLKYDAESTVMMDRLYSLLCDGVPQSTPQVMPNIGAASALSYYSGYLRLILPDIFQRCSGQGFVCTAPCKGRCECGPEACILPATYLLIVPSSLKAPPALSEWDERISDEEKQVTMKKNGEEQDLIQRGGLARNYDTTVHSIKTSDKPPKHYRFLGEVPNILINLNDQHDRVIGLTPYQRQLEAQQFYTHLQILIDSDPHCRGKVTFLFCDDSKSGFMNTIGDRILKVIKSKIENDPENYLRFTEPTNIEEDGYNMRNCVRIKSPAVAGRRNELNYYDIHMPEGDEPIGPAIIFNLRSRQTADTENMIRNIQECVSCLRFSNPFVETKTGSTVMESMQKFTSEFDENVQAFICVILANGKDGEIFDRDGRPFDFCDLVEIVSRSRVLRDKPVIFIVEASQESPSEQMESVHKVPSSTEGTHSRSRTTRSRLTPNVNNFLAYFSGEPGCKEDAVYSVTFIDSLCKQINEKARTMVLEDILKGVTKEISGSMQVNSKDDLGVNPHYSVSESLAEPKIPFMVSTMTRNVDFSKVVTPLGKK